MDDRELHDLADTLRQENPALSLEQALDAAAALAAELGGVARRWDARAARRQEHLAAYATDWDRMAAAAAAARAQ